MRLKLASRSSALAKIQAYHVAAALKGVGVDVDFFFKQSFGDLNLDAPLASMESKGVFTQDFFEDLKAGRFDLVVHSWKDLPTEARDGTSIVATLPRADTRDMLVLPNACWEQARETGVLEVFSSSPRRQYNLENRLKELLPSGIQAIRFATVRGNIPTRIRKALTQQKGLIVAKAAMDRLILSEGEEFADVREFLRERIADSRWMVLPWTVNPGAAAQGAIAIEIAAHRKDLVSVFEALNHVPTFEAVKKEREILRSYGGGCHQKIGVVCLKRDYGEILGVKGLTDAGEVLDQWNLQPMDLSHVPRSAVFPESLGGAGWFDRGTLTLDRSVTLKDVFVARADAWTEQIVATGVVWAAGVESWRRLAQKGVWVHGCQDGLGEAEDRRLEFLERPMEWTKLTHDRSTVADSVMPTLSTYRLLEKPKDASPNLTGKTHFYWTSPSGFSRAKELYPKEIQNGRHFSGPGLTHRFLNAQKLAHAPGVFLSLDAFLKTVLGVQ